jgi:hypothetical protein
MSDSNIVIRKKRGRPRTGQTPVVSLRLEPEWQQDIDEWRHGEPDQLSRSEAIRMLLGMGKRYAACAMAALRPSASSMCM